MPIRYLYSIIGLLQLRFMQPAYLLLYKASLALMNYGIGVEDNGERFVLKKLSNYASSKERFTIFDVGANIGQYSMLIDEYIPQKRIYAFEPSRGTFSQLIVNIKHITDASSYNFGFSNQAQTLVLYYGEGDAGDDLIHSCASLYSDNITSYLSKGAVSEEICLDTIDHFCIEQDITHIDFLKMDVEGHELNCLQGAKNMLRAGDIEMIQIELNRCAIASRTFLKDYWDLLSEAYCVYRMLSGEHGLYKIVEYHTFLENFTYMNYIFIRKDSPLNDIYK